MPAPGWAGRRGIDRERLAALPVARLRLRPWDRPAAGGLHGRGDGVRRRGARGRRVRRAAGARAAWPYRRRRGGRDAGGPRRRHRVRHGRPLQPRPRRRDAPGRGARRAEVRRHPPRGCRVVRRQRLREAHRSPGRMLRHRRPGLDEPADRPVRRQARRRAGAGPVGAGPVERPRPRRLPGRRPPGGVPRRLGLECDRLGRQRPCGAGCARRQARGGPAWGGTPGVPRRGAGAAERRRRRDARRPDRQPADPSRGLGARRGGRRPATRPSVP